MTPLEAPFSSLGVASVSSTAWAPVEPPLALLCRVHWDHLVGLAVLAKAIVPLRLQLDLRSLLATGQCLCAVKWSCRAAGTGALLLAALSTQ